MEHFRFGRQLPPSAIDADVARSFAVDRAHVPLHAAPPGGLAGATDGDVVALAPEARGSSFLARAVAAHELAHLTDPTPGSASDREARADRSAVDALLGRRVGPGRHEHRGGARRERRGPPRLEGCQPSAAARARTALDRFAAMSAADQEAMVRANYRSGSYAGAIRTHLEALPAEERSGRYRATIQRVMELVERQEVRASTGMTDAQMATSQAAFMDAEAVRIAAASTGGAPPTAAQVQQAHQASVAQQNLPPRATNRWAALPVPPDPAQANFRARAATAVSRIVARAAVRAPHLHITDANLFFNPTAIDGAADTRFAEYDSTNRRLNFGMDFTDAAMANVDYVLGTVVHELFGHGEYGGINDSYPLSLYQAARSQTTQALSPAERAGPMSSSERFGYGYQGTEIYSELREAEYDLRLPAGSTLTQGDRPADDIRARVGLIKEKWQETIAIGILRGMYARFALDPRVTPTSLQLFVDAVNHHYPGKNLLAARP